MSEVKRLLEDLDDKVALEIFIEAQQSTIVEQSRRITELEKELDQTKLNNKISLIGIIPQSDLNVDDEETIARTQIKLLRNSALMRELTLEECKKAEILLKILYFDKENKKKNVLETKKLSNKELLDSLATASGDE